MLIPRKVKHRKQHHPSRSGAAKGGTQVAFGDFGIQALAEARAPKPERRGPRAPRAPRGEVTHSRVDGAQVEAAPATDAAPVVEGGAE